MVCVWVVLGGVSVVCVCVCVCVWCVCVLCVLFAEAWVALADPSFSCSLLVSALGASIGCTTQPVPSLSCLFVIFFSKIVLIRDFFLYTVHTHIHTSVYICVQCTHNQCVQCL